MNGLGGLIQYFLFIVFILVMTRLLGFSGNGWAVIASLVLGSVVYWGIYILSMKFGKKRSPQSSGNTLKRGNIRDRKKMNK